MNAAPSTVHNDGRVHLEIQQVAANFIFITVGISNRHNLINLPGGQRQNLYTTVTTGAAHGLVHLYYSTAAGWFSCGKL